MSIPGYLLAGLGLLSAVASLTVPGGQEFHFPLLYINFQSIFHLFLKLFAFFLTLVLRVPGKTQATLLDLLVNMVSNSKLVKNGSKTVYADIF